MFKSQILSQKKYINTLIVYYQKSFNKYYEHYL